MALNYSALLSLLSQLKDTDLTDRVRTGLERVYQELIDAEAQGIIGIGSWEHGRTPLLSLGYLRDSEL